MQHLVSRKDWEAGTNRPLNIEMFRDHDFVQSQSSPAAVADYQRLLAAGTHIQSHAFFQAFGPYFMAPHDIADWGAAAERYAAGWPKDMDSAAPEVKAAKATVESLLKSFAAEAQERVDAAAEAATQAEAAANFAIEAAKAAREHADALAAAAK